MTYILIFITVLCVICTALFNASMLDFIGKEGETFPLFHTNKDKKRYIRKYKEITIRKYGKIGSTYYLFLASYFGIFLFGFLSYISCK